MAGTPPVILHFVFSVLHFAFPLDAKDTTRWGSAGG
jgi:hypothetical protein